MDKIKWITVSDESLSDPSIPGQIRSELEGVKLPESYYDFTFCIDRELKVAPIIKPSDSGKDSECWKIGYLTRNPREMICLWSDSEVGIANDSDRTYCFMNSSLSQFVEALEVYMELQEKFEEGILDGEDDEVLKYQTEKFRSAIEAIDPAVFLNDKSYWPDLMFEMEHGL